MILTSKTIKRLITDGVDVFDKQEERLHKPLIENVDPSQLEWMEGGAYDLRIAEVYETDLSPAVLTTDRRITPRVEPWRKTIDENTWCVYYGVYYLVRTIEQLNLPANIRGRIVPRTSLFRCGLMLLCSDVHPNYQGALTLGLMEVRGSSTSLSVGTRIASVIFELLESGEPDLYQGIWQGGRVSTDGKEERAY